MRTFGAYAQGIDWRAIPAERAAEFGQHPALAGWGLLDEPRAEHFPELAAWNRTLGERTPGKLRFTNLLPLGCPPEQTGAKTYVAIVVNRDYTKPVECDITAGAKVKDVLMVNAADGAESAPPLTDGTMHLCLQPGEGRLFRLQIE